MHEFMSICVMDFIIDILVNLISDGISFLIGVTFVFLLSFFKKSIRIKKLYQNTQNLFESFMNFVLKKTITIVSYDTIPLFKKNLILKNSQHLSTIYLC